MTTAPATTPTRGTTASGRGSPHPLRRVPVLVVAGTVLLALTCLLSVAVGAQSLGIPTVLHAVFGDVGGMAQPIVDARLGRTLIGLLVGVAIGVAGVAMQGVTRNPLADPGILGVNSGASLLVVIGINTGIAASQLSYVLLALAGGCIAAVLVYAVASLSPGASQPITMALAGAALTAGCTSVIAGILVYSRSALDTFRFWQVGSIAGHSLDTVPITLPFLAIGALLVLPSGSVLNALAMGDEVARAVGQRVLVGRALVAFGAMLLCAAATSLAGPIAFVGLVVPHIVRLVVGADYRRILLGSLFLGPALILLADTLGRVITPPSEVSVGVMTAVLGAPALIFLVRKGSRT